MPDTYPPLIRDNHFPEPPPVDVVGACAHSERRCGVQRLELHGHPSAAEGFAQPPQQLPAGGANRYVLAPVVEQFNIRWQLQGHAHVRKVKLELFRRDEPLPFWSKALTWADAGARQATGTTPFDGRLADNVHLQSVPAGTVEVTYNPGPTFPRDVLTVEHAPYRLVLRIVEVEQDTVVESVARSLYLDVLVHDVKLELGPQAWLPPAASAQYRHVRLHALHTDTYQAVAQQLQGAHPAPLPLSDAQAPQDVRVRMRSNVFARSVADFYTNTVFAGMRTQWQGDGAVLPVVATLRVRQSDGQPAPVQQGAQALGNLAVLWDWASADDNLPEGTHARAADFIRDALHYRPNEWPHARANCHIEHGGKRGLLHGNALPHFAAVPSPPAPATPLVDAANRPWATFTRPVTDPLHAQAGKTAVLFLPSAIAGDSYRLSVYAAYPRIAALDVADAAAFREAAAATRSVASRSTLTVWRRVEVARHWRKHAGVDAASLDWAAVVRYFQAAFVELALAPHGVQNLAGLAYVQAFNDVSANLPIAIRLALGDAAHQHDGGYGLTFRPWAEFRQRARVHLTQQMLAVRAANPATDADVLNAQAPLLGGRHNAYREDLLIPDLQTLALGAEELTSAVLRRVDIRDEATYLSKVQEWGDEVLAKLTGRLTRNIAAGEQGIHLYQFDFVDNYHHQNNVAEASTTVPGVAQCPSCNHVLPADAPVRWWTDADNEANRNCTGCDFRLDDSCVVTSFVPFRYMNGRLDAWANQNLGFTQRAKIRAGGWYGTTAAISIAHEIGHQLGMPHAGPNPRLALITVMRTGGIHEAFHDRDDDACIMSYNFTRAPHLHFCGFCNLRLRGWSVGPSDMNTHPVEFVQDQHTVPLRNRRADNRRA
jgi:hypothetical protein